MTWREQIVSIKVKYDDGACTPEHQKTCCGPGACENEWEFDPKEDLHVQDSPCCTVENTSIEVLQESPQYEILTEQTFE